MHVEAGQGGIQVTGEDGTAVERHTGDDHVGTVGTVCTVGPGVAQAGAGPDPGGQVAKEHARAGGSERGR
ncbi:hypothetical protein GCM10009721_31500 [Terrabacter tumescens]|uniref:Uncharacterized protein n=1 Tax=Terrabacter tumescens TaxID=60443 RepID=A0ABQ2I769_9MICO|nr:hypothetical protein GCM10009721_31500 [Terrabacter tumescens]